MASRDITREGGREGLRNLVDSSEIAREGRRISEAGIRYVVDGIIPAYGMFGLLVAYAKVGKTTFSQALGGAVGRGEDFVGRSVEQKKVLYVAAEDPREYTAWIARHLDVPIGQMTFCTESVVLDADGVTRICNEIEQGNYGLVIIASWQSVVRGLIKSENDNAAALEVVERIKQAARSVNVPWLVDAHSGRHEDQADDADPIRALRGASAAAGAADYILSLRYADGTFGRKRRLAGRGRFVNLPTQTLDYDPATGLYTCLGNVEDAQREADWRAILASGALDDEWRTAGRIAKKAGIVNPKGKVESPERERVHISLRDRSKVARQTNEKTGVSLRRSYRLVGGA